MRIWKTIVMAGIGAAFLLPAITANAADLLEPIVPVIPQPEAIPPQPVGGGFYLRGDVGYKIYASHDVSFVGASYVNEDVDNTALLGGGIGYRFNPWLRADITGDYEFPARFHGNLSCAACGAGGGAGFSNEYAKISAATFLANAYIDLGTWYGFTPYVGGGIGASYVMVDDYHFVNPNGVTGVVGGDGKWNFAWAAMAGVAFDITPNLVLDVNYRYLSLGDGQTKPFTARGATQPVEFKNLAAHEVRVGLRYQFN
jgi:opacity protein-like surface antigen